jgi:hypothetical protein
MINFHTDCEGCVFQRGGSTTATILPTASSYGTADYDTFSNSKSIDMPMGVWQAGLALNSAFLEPQYNQQGVLVLPTYNGTTSQKTGVSVTTLLPGTPNPVPQVLWGVAFASAVAPSQHRTPLRFAAGRPD